MKLIVNHYHYYAHYHIYLSVSLFGVNDNINNNNNNGQQTHSGMDREPKGQSHLSCQSGRSFAFAPLPLGQIVDVARRQSVVMNSGH